MITAIGLGLKIMDGVNEFHVLQNVNLSIEKGEYVCINGAMASGKSTLLKLFGVLISPSEGELYVLDQDITHFSEKQMLDFRKGKISYLYSDSMLLDNLTIEENIELPLIYLNCSKRERKERVLEQLEIFNLSHKSGIYPKYLTQSQKQIVALARCMVINPKLLLADEPTGRLTANQSLEFLSHFEHIHSKGVTIVLATQSADIAKDSERVLKMHEGHVGAMSSII